MKLTEANKGLNRKFHELPPESRLEFLLKAYAQVFPKDESARGEFTPAQISPETLETQGGFNGDALRRFLGDDDNGQPTRKSNPLFDTIHTLNFLMTRFNMLGDPAYEDHIRELALLRFDYQLVVGDDHLTHNPELIATYYTKRGLPHYIRPVLERMAEHAIDYDFLAEKIIGNPVFVQHVGAKTNEYKFRTRLHALVHDEHFSKEQTAAALMQDGFDLVASDFNKWFAYDSSYDIRRGAQAYEPSAKETRWLAQFVAAPQGTTTTDEPIVSEDDEEPGRECKCSKEGIETLDAQVTASLQKFGDKTPHWIRLLPALTADCSALTINESNTVEANMWDYIWGGQFQALAYQLKGANPHGRTRKGLNYNKWALLHEQHGKTINPTLAQDSYAMIIAGDILVGDLSSAIEDFTNPALQAYKDSHKIEAAVNLAWEMMQHPGESDEHKGYEPPRRYLFHVAKEFLPFLRETPNAAPYRALLCPKGNKKLGKEAEKILGSIRDLNVIEDLYIRFGRSGAIQERFIQIFKETFDEDAQFCSLSSDVGGIVKLVQDPMFRKYVDDKTISACLGGAVIRTLERKSKYDASEDQRGAKKLVATIYQHPVLHPYVGQLVDIGSMVKGMIDDVVDIDEPLLVKPFSLRGSHEICLDIGEILEAYHIADACRSMVAPGRMTDLVAYLIAMVLDARYDSNFTLSQSLMLAKAKNEGTVLNEQAVPHCGRMEFLSHLYRREKQLGGIDPAKVSTAVTNILFRSNYVEPQRYYPHLDTMMQILDSPLAELLPTTGPGHDAIKEYRLLHDFLRGPHVTEP